jgi:hypothetical protein
MEFLKKNYEKIVLGVVLLGLTISACLLPFMISGKRAALESLRVSGRPKVQPLPPVDVATETAASERAAIPLKLDYTTKHNLFNPVLWKKFPDGRLLKESTGNEEGADALEVTNVEKLYLILSYNSPSANGYLINIERQNERRESKRHTQNFVSSENKSELLSLKDIKGPPDKPTELDLVWNETGEIIPLNPNQPFKRVEGYAADLKYPLAQPVKTWTDRRVGDRLVFANGYYNIVAITESNVVVSAESNKKKTTITFHPATEPR